MKTELPRICHNEASTALRDFLGRIGEKWSLLAVVMLARAPGRRARFSELQRMLDGISQRMLTSTLRDLERDGFVVREVFPEVPPRVEYELTPLGASLLEPVEHLVRWFETSRTAIDDARRRFDGRKA